LAAVVSFALFSVVLVASVLGTLIPLGLDKFGINPALASGPFITTANDLVGLAIYFLIIHILYSS
jgi:magnesium transporter